jgi:hypothetical protein
MEATTMCPCCLAMDSSGASLCAVVVFWPDLNPVLLTVLLQDDLSTSMTAGAASLVVVAIWWRPTGAARNAMFVDGCGGGWPLLE